MSLAESAARFFGRDFTVHRDAVQEKTGVDEQESVWFEKDAKGEWITETTAGTVHIQGGGLRGLQNIEGLVKALQESEKASGNGNG